ncbi:hypothetical protein pb186bvf_016300 [Paramecium bursaria]
MNIDNKMIYKFFQFPINKFEEYHNQNEIQPQNEIDDQTKKEIEFLKWYHKQHQK